MNDEYSRTSFTTIVVTDPGDECTFNQNLKLRLRLIDVDSLSPDDKYSAGDTLVVLNCELFDQLTGPGWQQDFTVFASVLPANEDIDVNYCDNPGLFTAGWCLGQDGALIGRSNFTRRPDPSLDTSGLPQFPVPVAYATWEAKAAILAR